MMVGQVVEVVLVKQETQTVVDKVEMVFQAK
jgi:hypothetical protein